MIFPPAAANSPAAGRRIGKFLRLPRGLANLPPWPYNGAARMRRKSARPSVMRMRTVHAAWHQDGHCSLFPCDETLYSSAR